MLYRVFIILPLRKVFVLFLLSLLPFSSYASYRMGLLKYSGGGDWYVNMRSSLPNLIDFCNQNLHTNFEPQVVVEVGSALLFNCVYVHLTGHGNIYFSEQEAQNLRTYLEAGGFLHIDDNYGLKEFAQREMKKVFPHLKWQELSPKHSLFKAPYIFPKGLPKIHEHDGKRPQAFALFWKGRMVALLTYESDLGDGWEDASVHNDPKSTRTTALRMGANIIHYVLTH